MLVTYAPQDKVYLLFFFILLQFKDLPRIFQHYKMIDPNPKIRTC